MKQNQQFSFLILLLFTFAFIFTSCQKYVDKSDDFTIEIENAKLRSSVNNWLNEQKIKKPETALFIDSIRTSINWISAKLSPTVSSDYVTLYCPISYNKNSSGLIFTISKKDWAIKRGIISEIKFDNDNHDSEAGIIAKLNCNQTPNFSGSISVYTISNKFVYECGFRNGIGSYVKKIEENATSSAGIITNSIQLSNELPKQVNGCTQFYLVTYWSDGTVDRKFLSSYCDDDGGCEQTRVLSPSSGEVYTTNCNSQNPGGGSSLEDLMMLIFYAGPNPIKNLKEYIECFTADGTNCTVSILVDQPNETNGDMNKGLNVGHTFLTFSQTMKDGTIVTRNIGFYPAEKCTPWSQTKQGQLNNDEGHIWNVGLKISVSTNNFLKILNYMTGPMASIYNLSNNNCATMALNALNKGGIEIFTAKGFSFLLGGTVYGYCPGRLGQDIKGMDLDPMFFSNWERIYPPNDQPSSSSHPNKGHCK